MRRIRHRCGRRTGACVYRFCAGGSGGGSDDTVYHVDYSGSKDAFSNAEDTYRPGQEVELYYEIIATDTDYSFYLDDELLNAGYAEDKGYILKFTMPEHDVTIRVESRNSMMYIPPDQPADLETYVDHTGLRKEIDDIDEDSMQYMPLGIDTIYLTEEGELILEFDDALEYALGEYVLAAEGVKDVWLLPFGNGGYRTVAMIREDGTVSAVNMTKLLTDQELEVMDGLGGYHGAASLESAHDVDAWYVEVVLDNGERYMLDEYLK